MARYLGDGLYADYDGYQIELYASNGVEKTNAVYLEPGVLAAFQAFVADIHNAKAIKEG